MHVGFQSVWSLVADISDIEATAPSVETLSYSVGVADVNVKFGPAESRAGGVLAAGLFGTQVKVCSAYQSSIRF